MQSSRRTPLAAVLPLQRRHVDRLLREQGITESRFGAELEFSLYEEPNPTWDAPAEALRVQAIAHLRAAGGQNVEQKIAEVRTFNRGELAMFALHDLEPATRGILEPAFGTGGGDNTYYDNHGIFEAKIKPCDSATFARNLQTFTDTVEKLGRNLGVRVGTNFSPHLNISFWKDGKNLCDPLHPEFTTTAARIFRGIQQATADAILITDRGDSPFLDVDAGLDRHKRLRITGEGERGRIELRLDPPERERSYDLPLIIEGIVKPGALFGLKLHNAPVTITKRGVFTLKGDQFPATLHTLQGSEVVPTTTPGEFRLIPPKGYIMAMTFRPVYRSICRELGLEYLDSDKVLHTSQYTAEITRLKRMSVHEAQQTSRVRKRLPANPTALDLAYKQFWEQVQIGAESVNWPQDSVFLDLFQKRRDTLCKDHITDQGLLKLLAGTRLIQQGDGTFAVRWPATKQIGGSEWPLVIPYQNEFQSAVHCTDIVPAFTAPAIKKFNRDGLRDRLLHSEPLREGQLHTFHHALRSHLDQIFPRRDLPGGG